jgi:hypothetical protein
MALFEPIFFAALFLEDNDFLGFALPQNLTYHPGPGHQGLPHLDGIAVGYQEHLLDQHFVSPLSGEVFYPQDVPRTDPVLFPARLDNGEQGNLQKKSNL